MAGRTVHLKIGGQTYRVVTSANDEELKRLASAVDEKLAAVVPPGRAVTPQAMLLAAMALAHELEEERERSAWIATKLSGARGAFNRMIAHVDAALAPGATAAASAAPATLLATLPERPSMIPAGLRPSAPPTMGPSSQSAPNPGLLRMPPGPVGPPANES